MIFSHRICAKWVCIYRLSNLLSDLNGNYDKVVFAGAVEKNSVQRPHDIWVETRMLLSTRKKQE